MIVSAFDGRIRIVEPGLKVMPKADTLEKRLVTISGITSVRINRTIGSLLVCYDTTTANVRAVQAMLKKQIRAAGIHSRTKVLNTPETRRYVKWGMLGTITASIGFLFVDSEKWHFRMGTTFLSFLSFHLLQNRKRLLK